MTLKDDLIAARALISTPGTWWNGVWGDRKEGCKCAGEAVEAVTRNDEHRLRVFEALAQPIVVTNVRSAVSRIVDFNDDPTTTHNDVLVLFDRAINACEAA